MGLMDEVRKYGQRSAERMVLPEFAIMVAISAKKGIIDESDTNRIYETYYKAAHRVTDVPPAASMRVNASKLRQVIKAADPELLQKVRDAWLELVKRHPVRPLYWCMVEACRVKLRTHRALGARTIAEIITKPR